jgi:hypothetical protein
MQQNSFYEAVTHSAVQEIPHMISEYSLLCSQWCISGPYADPPKCSPYPTLYLIKINLVISTNLGLQSGHYFSGLPTTISYHFLINL